MAGRPTIIDVARKAGVSKSTVSLVLQNSSQVREATRQSVRDAMRADGRHRGQVPFSSLWCRDTPWGEDGYNSDLRYDDESVTSFHVLTADGILGRDVISN